MQRRFAVLYKGEDTSILFHVWREQEYWVHLYASRESEGLVNAIKNEMGQFARAEP